MPPMETVMIECTLHMPNAALQVLATLQQEQIDEVLEVNLKQKTTLVQHAASLLHHMLTVSSSGCIVQAVLVGGGWIDHDL